MLTKSKIKSLFLVLIGVSGLIGTVGISSQAAGPAMTPEMKAQRQKERKQKYEIRNKIRAEYRSYKESLNGQKLTVPEKRKLLKAKGRELNTKYGIPNKK